MNENATRLRRLRYRAWHRGTREADFLVGGFFDRYSDCWDSSALDWFEHLLEEQDVDIIAWAFGRASPPEALSHPLLVDLMRLDYIDIPR